MQAILLQRDNTTVNIGKSVKELMNFEFSSDIIEDCILEPALELTLRLTRCKSYRFL